MRRGRRGSLKALTPLERAPAALAEGRDLWLKREDVHQLGAFKWRGAEPAVQALRAGGATAVVTASTGNHGAATAWVAARCGLRAIVFAPQDVSRTKLALLQQHGADVRLMGRDMDDAKAEARRFAKDHAYPFFEDGAEPAQYRGYGAIGEEILDQLDRPPATVVVPVGNGALIGGIGQTIRRRSPETAVVGVVAKEAPVMALSFEAGQVVACDRSDTFADGLAVRVAIPYAVEVLGKVVTRMLRVSERELARAVATYASAGIRVEAAAAAALAALPRLGGTGPVVLLVTGSNIDDGTYGRALSQTQSFPD